MLTRHNLVAAPPSSVWCLHWTCFRTSFGQVRCSLVHTRYFHYSQYCSASFLFFTVLCAATKQTIFSWYLYCICYAACNQFGTSLFSLWIITIYNVALTISQSRYAFNLSGEMVPPIGCLEIDQLPPVLARKWVRKTLHLLARAHFDHQACVQSRNQWPVSTYSWWSGDSLAVMLHCFRRRPYDYYMVQAFRKRHTLTGYSFRENFLYTHPASRRWGHKIVINCYSTNPCVRDNVLRVRRTISSCWDRL